MRPTVCVTVLLALLLVLGAEWGAFAEHAQSKDSAATPVAGRDTPVFASTSKASKLHSTAAGRAPPHVRVSVDLVLRHDNEEGMATLTDALWAVSTPGSDQEGEYWTGEQVRPFLEPSAESQAAVEQWLVDTGLRGDDETVIEWSPWRNHVFLHTTVAQVEAATGLELHAFGHTSKLPALQGRYVIVAAGRTVAPHHPLAAQVASVRVSGNVAAAAVTPREDVPTNANGAGGARVLRGGDAAAGSEPSAAEPTLYPYEVWPPPQVINAGLASASSLGIEVFLMCPIKTLWPTHTYPFLSRNTMLDLPAQETEGGLSPCGDNYGDITAFHVTLTDDSGASQTKIWQMDQNDVTTTDYKILAECQASGLCYQDTISLTTAEFGVEGFNCDLDVPYKVTVGVVFEFQPNTVYNTPWAGSPNNVDIRVIATQPKLPSILNQFYHVPASPVSCEKNNRQSIGVLQGAASGFYSPSDLNSFYTAAGISTMNTKQVQFVGSAGTNATLQAYLTNKNYQTQVIYNNPAAPGLETSLDVQYISGMAPGTRTMVYHGGYFITFDPTLNELVQVDAMQAVFLAIQYAAKPPLVLSMSYGMPEPSMSVINSEYRPSLLAFGVMGITVIASSGDTGSHMGSIIDSAAQTCASTKASYPATSPYVTAVGATQMQKINGAAVEVAASIEQGCGITSGGGFSAEFGMPEYQTDAVNAYFSRANLPLKYLGKRAMPDVAVYGNNFRIYYSGGPTEVDGTSASAPSFAGMVSLWNDYLLRNGKAPLGFLNPRLYKAYGDDSSIMNDITSGSNRCLGQDSPGICCAFGFEAGVGFDAISGLGSPDFAKLGAALINGTWTKGSCTVAQAACRLSCASTCDAAGYCGDHLAAWAIALIVVGVMVCCVGSFCVFRSCNSKGAGGRNMSAGVDREVYRDAGGQYVTMSPAGAPTYAPPAPPGPPVPAPAYVQDW